MDPARGNDGATGYHRRHDPSALPSRGARGDLHVPVADARRAAVRREGGLNMARVAAAFGSSHSVMLAAELQDWLSGFRQSDLRMKYYDREGRPRSYADVL